jgi:hypothetical protein
MELVGSSEIMVIIYKVRLTPYTIEHHGVEAILNRGFADHWGSANCA